MSVKRAISAQVFDFHVQVEGSQAVGISGEQCNGAGDFLKTLNHNLSWKLEITSLAGAACMVTVTQVRAKLKS